MGDRKAPTDSARKPAPPPPDRDLDPGKPSPPTRDLSELIPPAPRDPETPTEWQEAVDAADLYLLVESARAYGLVTGGPDVDLARCEEILKRGRGLGYRPKEVK